MALYRKKPVTVEAELFKLGMEDGYACYHIFNGGFIGYYFKGEPVPKTDIRPAIKTLHGWYEVEEGKHYIVTGVKGGRYPVEKEKFEELYDLVDVKNVVDIKTSIKQWKYIKNKADMIAYTGDSIVEDSLVDTVLKELENYYEGNYYAGTSMNGITIIEKARD